jgi:hypothetical protein
LSELLATFHRVQLFKVQIEIFNLAILCQLFQTNDQLINHLILAPEVLFALLTALNLNNSLEPSDNFLVAGLTRLVSLEVISNFLPETN